MIYYGLVFIAAVIFSIGLMLMQRPFFQFAYNTTSLLNAVLDDVSDEDAKQKVLISKVGALLQSMFVGFILPLALSVLICLIPLFTYSFYFGVKPESFDTSSVYFYGSMLLGGLIPFLIPIRKPTEDYSPWSKLLHRMILDHPFISKQLFFIERRLFLKSKPKTEEPFLLVTGLARAGTTAMTQLLFQAGSFHSLSYANMPFLMAPNIWKKFYDPKDSELKERAHGDNLQFGYETIEALEEQFFKTFTNNSFIADDRLLQHEIDSTTVSNYLDYQQLVADNAESTYLAKNNNLILRYESLKNSDTNFNVLMVVRNPIDHAVSLLKQHKRFQMLHEADEFTLEYMNWLGHHEFGKNHKPFELGENLHSSYKLDDINYWLACWIEYYTFILPFIGDGHIHLIDYTQLAENPQKLLESISGNLNIQLNSENAEAYGLKHSNSEGVDDDLHGRAEKLYTTLSTSFI